MTRPRAFHEDLLSSITSTELRKIIFRVRHTLCWRPSPEVVDRWTRVDEQLCGLVTRLHVMGYCHTLEVDLRFEIADGPEKHGSTDVLPKFKERGVVTIHHGNP